MQVGFTLPILGTVRVGLELVQDFAGQSGCDLEVGGDLVECAVEFLGEGEQVVAMVGEQGADLAEDRAGGGHPLPQFGEHEIVEVASLVVARIGHGPDVEAEPIEQQSHVVGQGDGGEIGRAHV